MWKTVGNILWHFPFFGFVNAVTTYVFGVLLTATVVAAPIGLGLMEHGKFLFAPFSRDVVSKAQLGVSQNAAWKTYCTIIMVFYIPLIGIPLAALTILQIAGLFISILGIPVALVLAKSLGTYFNPVNKKCVPLAVGAELAQRRASAEVARHLGAIG